MSDDVGVRQERTVFANVVTSNLYPDELVLEFRRYFQEHSALLKSEHVQEIPPPSPEEIFNSPMLARVVLTFTAAKGLRDYLNTAMPRMEAARKQGDRSP